MRALFRKDLRENFGIAILGAAILSIILFLRIGSAESAALQMVTNGGSSDDLQPALSNTTLSACTFFCAIFAGLLGFVQSRNESHRDMWAFLIHRPVTRTHIFLGKTSAGLLLYILGSGIPVLFFTLYISIPGHIAAPFEWAMVWPMVMTLFGGIAYYFAGMITGLRQARWFGSKTFAFGGAVATTVSVFNVSGDWQEIIVVALVLVILSVALWGAYQSGGLYRGQPFAGKLALVLSLSGGSCVLIFLAAVLFQSTLGRDHRLYNYRTYSITWDGNIYIESNNSGNASFTSLDGKPFIDSDTGKPITAKDFMPLRSATYTAHSDYNRKFGNYRRYQAFFKPWSFSGKNLWYTDRHGKLIGFNADTRQPLGEIVLGGAFENDSLVELPYTGDYMNSYNLPHLIATHRAVYLVDLDSRQFKPIFTTTAANPIGGFYEAEYATNALILTKETIFMVDSVGRTYLKLPYQPGPETYTDVTVANHLTGTNQPNQFIVMLNPDYYQNSKSGWKMPVKVITIPKQGGVTNSMDLPALHEPDYKQPFEDLLAAFEPMFSKIKYTKLSLKKNSLPAVCLCGLCAGVTFFFGRRYKFSNGALITWTLFVFLGGLFALTTFFCAQEFPAREVCPKCGKLRTVDHELCDHCGAEFAPPEKNGTEIFEPLPKKVTLETVAAK